MHADVHIETERLVLRTWKDSDREPFVALNADPEVMKYFPGTMTPDEADTLIARLIA